MDKDPVSVIRTFIVQKVCFFNYSLTVMSLTNSSLDYRLSREELDKLDMASKCFIINNHNDLSGLFLLNYRNRKGATE